MSDDVVITLLKRHLQSEFEMKDLGFLCYFLRIEIAYSSRGYLLSHQQYIADLLDRATLSDHVASVSFSVSALMKLHLKFRRDDGTPLPQRTQYRKLMGSPMYLSATSPDNSQAVHVLNQFVSAPTSAHNAALLAQRSITRVLMTTNSCSYSTNDLVMF